MTNGNGSLVGWMKEKLGLVPTFGPPPVAYTPPPRPIPVLPQAQGLPTAPESASLVGTRSNAKGRLEDTGSLVGGR